MKAPLPDNENERLQTLRSYEILDTDAEKAFDDLTFLASHICKAPIAIVSLVDRDRQWFKSKIGLDVDETPRDLAFCAHAILDDDVLVVPDATQDERFADNPLVLDGPAIRFYAGAPLIAPTGHALGTLCVIDGQPREFSLIERQALQMLAGQVISQLELRRRIEDLEFTTEALQRMTDAAVRANEAKSEFLAGMSHELRTPLNAIIGFSEGLLARADKHPLTAHQKDRVGRMQLAGQHLLTLINDLLDLAKVESGEMQVHLSTFDPGGVLAEVGDLAEALVADGHGAVRCIVQRADLPAMTADRDKIKQVLINLASNAVKFSEGGDVTLRVRHDGTRIAFDVIDTGIGIPPDQLESIFNKFHQVDTVHREGSTGLGLPLCRELTELLDGTLRVTSEPGRGSTFTLSLPAAPGASRRAA